MVAGLWAPPVGGPTRLWLVRHGQSEGNVIRDAALHDGLLEARMPARDADVELTQLGRAQARALGEWLGDQPNRPEAALASPFARTVQTAEQVCSVGLITLPLSVDERLRDRDMGILEELTWDGIQATFPAEAERAVRQGFFYYRPPGGESWTDICLRCGSFYADLARLPSEGVLIVAHDIVVQLSVALLTG